MRVCFFCANFLIGCFCAFVLAGTLFHFLSDFFEGIKLLSL